jgi:hypothetical protein
VALSVDDEATTSQVIVRYGLEFPVGYGAEARVLAPSGGWSPATSPG